MTNTNEHNIVSVSGGKDSTATLLLAIVKEVSNLQAVFADTGNEHPITYDYLNYLENTLHITIKCVRADFSEQINRKRELVANKWRSEDVSERIIEQALTLLIPTKIPFLDLCLWKGRFPSRCAQFCTTELKVNPIFEQVFLPLMANKHMILSWQGIRREESLTRRFLAECQEVGDGLFNYRPILKWTINSVFEAHSYMGIKPNPLYLNGMSRVGCMPCINCSKDELLAIGKRYPDEIERIKAWEALVSKVSKRSSATFFKSDYRGHGIVDHVAWSKTSRGGNQYDLLRIDNDLSCHSAYGLCE